MNGDPEIEARDGRREELMAEAQAVIAYSANSLRAIREQYRESHLDQVAHWEELRDELNDLDRHTGPDAAHEARAAAEIAAAESAAAHEAPAAAASTIATSAAAGPGAAADSTAAGRGLASDSSVAPHRAAAEARAAAAEARATEARTAAAAEATSAETAAEAGAADARRRSLRREEAFAARAAGAESAELARLELALKSLEGVWLFLSHQDASLVTDPGDSVSATDIQMRIVEAQEAERTRLAREVHDGPAQALANAIFQVEIVERLFAREPVLAMGELRLLRDLLRRELGDVRAFISQLRPPILADLGLAGAIRETSEGIHAMLGIPISVDLDPAIDALPDASETVLLRIIQEALQNVRRHADAHRVTIRGVPEGDDWIVEVQDDGRGFDVGAVAARGRRNFGLQFMRERAELIGARFEVRSRPDVGTVVRIAIPRGAEEKS